MNFTPTAVFVFILIIMTTVSIFGGYFQLNVEGGGLGVELPENIWALAISSVSFFFSMLIFSIPDMPYIFGIIWWLLSVLAIYSLIKIVWPGA